MRRGALLLVASMAALACQRDATPQHGAPSDAGGGERLSSRVHVDPSVVASGQVKVGRVERRALGEVRSYPGEVAADERGRAEAGTLVAGRVASLEVGVGAQVKRGQVLAWLDAPEVARVAADVMRARARVEVTARKEERQRELEKLSATSPNAIDEAHAEARIARAELAAAQSLLRSLGGVEPPAPTSASDPIPLTSRVAVRSPIDGVVSRRTAVLGGAASPDKELFEITAKGRVVVLARVPESLLDVPRAGTAVTIRSRASAAQSCAAQIQGEPGPVDTETRTRTLRAEPSDGCAWLVAGGFVGVELASRGDAGASAVLAVPRDAVAEVKGVPVVFVAEGDGGDFSVRTVQLGVEQGELRAVESGVAEGDRIAIFGAAILKGELLRSELSP